MRRIEIQNVLDVSRGAKASVSDDVRLHFMEGKDGPKAVLFTETYTEKPPVKEDETETDEFAEKWQLRPGSYWLHTGEGLQAKQFAPEIYFETETSKKVLNIFDSFIKNVNVSKRYKRLKRSYLIHSQPGCGKSALVRHFCRKISETPGLCVVQADGSVDFTVLTHMFNAEYHKDLKMIVLVIEDMGLKDHARNLSLYNSSCLNFLDGAASLFRVPTMIFATTNHAKELGPQFTNRPGRFNRIIKADLPSDEEVFALVEGYTGERLTSSEKEAFAGKGLTPDHCIEAILRSKIEGMSMPEAVTEILDERKGMMKWDD